MEERKKKNKEIEGVSANSIVELKALLFQKNNISKKTNLVISDADVIGNDIKPLRLRKKQRTETVKKDKDLYVSNRGVEDRVRKDEETSYKEDDLESWDYIQKRLKEKTKRYYQFASGEIEMDINDDNYTVDFISKEKRPDLLNELWDDEEQEQQKRIEEMEELVRQTEEGKAKHKAQIENLKRKREQDEVQNELFHSYATGLVDQYKNKDENQLITFLIEQERKQKEWNASFSDFLAEIRKRYERT